jgi:hypothetical protein
MTLAGLDTSVPQTFSARSLAQPQVRRLVPRVAVAFSGDMPKMASEVRVSLRDGRSHRAFHDAGIAARDLAAQQDKLEGKFQAIVGRVFGEAPAQRVSLAVRGLAASSLEPLVEALDGCAR